MSDIFISYASEDKEKADLLAKVLVQQGWSVWWDRRIPAGKTFAQVIEKELDVAKCVIVLWSNASISSHWVQTEASEGLNRKILVPVLIEKVKIPLSFRLIQTASLVDWQGQKDTEVNKLIEDVEAILSIHRKVKRETKRVEEKKVEDETFEQESKEPNGVYEQAKCQPLTNEKTETKRFEKDCQESNKDLIIVERQSTGDKRRDRPTFHTKRNRLVWLLPCTIVPLIVIIIVFVFFVIPHPENSLTKETNKYFEEIEQRETQIKMEHNYLSDDWCYKGNTEYEKKKYKNAIEYYTHAINKNPENAIAYKKKGDSYFQIKHFPKAIENYYKAVELDPTSKNAIKNMEDAYSQLKQYEESIEGNPKAQVRLGEFYEKGFGRKPDYMHAAKLFRKAAEQGYIIAMNNLGYLYEKGLGVERDSATALSWYQKASVVNKPITLDPGSLGAGTIKRLENLKIEIELRKSETESLRKQLEQTNWKLAEAQRELKQDEGDAEAEREKLEIEQQELEVQKKLHSSDYTQIKSLEEQLKQRKVLIDNKDQEITEMSQKIKHLENKTNDYNKQLKVMKEIQIALPGPSIVMINPPLVATRGIRIVNVSSELETERIIEGKVIAPAGLLSFTINDRNETVDKHGIFRVPINVKNTNVLVRLIAKDKQEKSTTIEFQLAPGETQTSGKKKNILPSKSFGDYYALIIGNSNYSKWPKLETPEKDALDIAELLGKKYGFKTKILIDATRYEILQALNELRMELRETDNLLIYYAGHGYLEERISRGYWIPVDADLDSATGWISTIQIADILSIMSVKHVMIIADSCYSGALTRSSLARLETGMSDKARRHWIKVMMNKRSRTALTSGDLQPVIDRGAGEHSVFAKALLDVLQENEDIIEGQNLHKEVSARVTYAASAVEVEQVPQYAPIRFAGHESGEFFLVPSQQ